MTLVAEVIGIDLGGTAIKMGRFRSTGQLLAQVRLPTPQPATPAAVITTIAQGVKELQGDHPCAALGVGVPGPADAKGRIARIAINLHGWRDVPLAEALEQATGLPTIIANDANCAGLGEVWIGAGQAFQDVILLTLGTGVGGAIILDGKLFTGRDGSAGELGLITLNPDGPPCNSGNQGSMEQYLSIGAIQRRTGMEPARLGELAAQGDLDALMFWQEYGTFLGAGLASLIYILTPEAIIIGGGIGGSAAYFLPTVREEIEKRVLPSSRDRLQLLEARLGNQAGIAGAAKLALSLIA